ncbi:hypothetical protein [uncultured Parabacteroides sp.]|uniref:hypothetical protein n=1 Tax=uncultured Parabacteroides sp. TaxID=512312 RepID=UPI00262BB432|nr:hypothetical protein [uncultured Parabacteroides sp.]
MNIKLTDILTIIGTLGGFEAAKWGINFWTNRKTNARIEDAHADVEEFKALREYNEFLQKQLSDKEERFVEQTGRLRKVQDELFSLKEENSNLKLELALKRCEKKKCGDREPQNGY